MARREDRGPGKITDEQRRECAAVHREATALAKYFDRHGLNFSATIAEATEPSHPFRARPAGLREARNDLLEMTVDLPPSDLRGSWTAAWPTYLGAMAAV
ncbi:MAG TPA: hypothetical protein VGC79_14345 [Polyangiaceae bacterium]